MKEPGQKPEFERPRPSSQPEEDQHNHLDKSDLDLKNGEAAFSAVPNEEIAYWIARLPVEEQFNPSIEEQTPLQLFGYALGALRRKLGLSVGQVASKSGLAASEIVAIEIGRASFEQVTGSLQPLGQALGGRYSQLSQLLTRLAVPGEDSES